MKWQTLSCNSNQKALAKLIVMLVSLSVLGFFFLEQVSHDRGYMLWLVLLPVFFCLIGYVSIRVLNYLQSARKEKYLVNAYLLMRGVKLFSLIALICFVILLLENLNVKHFLVTLVVFYVFHLVWETKFFFGYEKSLKTHQEL